jgi:preprotein translocase subunit SecF
MESEEKTQKNLYDRYYKLLLVIPLVILIFSLVYMYSFYSKNDDFILKDISLTGGTSVTLYGSFDSNKINQDLSNELGDIKTRDIYDLVTKEKRALIINTQSDADLTRSVLENYLGYELTQKNSSFEFTGSSLSEGFYKQLLTAILFAFFFMAIVVFIIFRTFVPSLAVIFSAFSDILMTLTLVNILGIEVSSAGIIAFLMLIGYSVDTDILLTSRVLKRTEGTLNHRIFGAFKTGITMTLTSIISILFAFLVIKSFSVTLSQIFTILLIGLGFDILNTWTTNASILKFYMERKK